MKKIAIFGTMDTKGQEYGFLKRQIELLGFETLVLDTGMIGEPFLAPDIDAETVAREGGGELKQLKEKRDRNLSITVMGDGSAKIIRRLYEEGKISGAIAIGGGQGTLLSSYVMRQLPIGFPKCIVSTIASLPKRMGSFEGINDTVTMNSIVDISGLNSVLKTILTNAAGVITGMVRAQQLQEKASVSHKVIGITMFGITTPCVTRVRQLLEAEGHEVLVFHCNGFGGRMMETMVRDGQIHAVVDVTPAEVTQRIMGGTTDAGPSRLEIPGLMGVPHVVSLGGVDCVNFMPPGSEPEKFKDRLFHMHSPTVKVMRTTPEENLEFGKVIAGKLNGAKDKNMVKVFIPLRGISDNDKPNGVFFDPEADRALFDSLKASIDPAIQVTELDAHINDEAFAEALAKQMLGML